MNKYYYNKDFFNKIDTEEKAYWLGFLYADGCIVTRSKCKKVTPMSLELVLSSIDINHLYKFLNSLESNIEIKNKIVELNGKKI